LQIPITTDRFSTYAITYSDTPVDETPEIPDTGDRTTVMPWILLEVVAFAALAVLIVIKKRRES
jgi:LPXTG-motif cell wall-anchored protein